MDSVPARSWLLTAVVLLALVAGGCRRSAAEQRAADRATAEAEERASETRITSAPIMAGEGVRAAVGDALHAQQLEYRERLQRALDALDARRAEAKRRSAAHLKLLDGRREVLKHHLDALDGTTDEDWAALKARIDRDLREQGSGSQGALEPSERQGR